MKDKKCVACGNMFPPIRLGQKVCDYKCSLKVIKYKKEKKFNKLIKDSGQIETRLTEKADRLYQIKLIQKYPKSLISESNTEVIHHRIKKSESNATRYYEPNGVPLTNKEHWDLHNGSASAKELEIDIKLGNDRLEDLNRKRKEIFKLTEDNLKEVIKKLEDL